MKRVIRHCEGSSPKQSPTRQGDCFSKIAMTLIILVVIALGNTNQAQAQAGIDMDSVATYVFGQQIVFVTQLKSPVQIQQATIVILDESQGVSHVRAVTFTDGKSEFVFDTQQNHIRPFSTVHWYYQLTLADGSAVQSASQTLHYDDNRYTWQKLEANSIQVFWVQGDTAFGQSALNAALSGLQSISNLFAPDLAQPINIYVYPSQSDISFLTGISWEAGQAYPDLGLVLVSIEPDSNQSVNLDQRIPHELMHVMLYRQVGAGYKNLPAWLNEGIATLAEINPTSDYDLALKDASNTNGLIPLADLCASFPADSASAFLAYAEARSFTNYLRDTYGAPSLLNLAKAYASGMDCENGFRSIYNISLSQVNAAWLEKSLGQNMLGVAFRNILPYLVLLLLVIFVPLLVGLNSSKPKADQNGSATSERTSPKR
jgi:peptidase MA superfamily protein